MIYDTLLDRRSTLIGPKHWLGNLRWMVEEIDSAGNLVFRTCPSDATESERPSPSQDSLVARRTLLGLKFNLSGTVEACDYRADGLSVVAAASRLSLLLPLERYVALIEMECLPGDSAAGLDICTAHAAGRRPAVNKPFSVDTSAHNRVVWRDGAYTVAFCFHASRGECSETGFTVKPALDGKLRLAVAFHLEPAQAIAEAEMLLARSEQARAESRQGWEDYLVSCPVAHFSESYTWQNPSGPVTVTAQEIMRRQYWHWHCLLSNAYQLPFNQLKAFMAPDKSAWFGVWSNDGPESLRALAHTSRHDLTRQCLVEYVRTAINAEGDLSWYLHGTGEGCLGRPCDPGRLSHGVPTIVTALAEYVSVTDDDSILDEPAGNGGTVWEKLTRYMHAVYQRRDRDHDGLVEWANLWEGGADDEVGPFFSRASLKQWCDAVTTFSEKDWQAFYNLNLCPVANLYEQAFFLRALQSLELLARRRGEEPTARYAHDRFDQTCRVLEMRHWDEHDGFYYDWDVRGQCLTGVKNQDAFYLPSFLRDPGRAARLFAHLDDPAEFKLQYTPTLARNEKGFDPQGYWCGGYWPREANYIALALNAAGYREKAIELLIKALCAGQGKIIPENMDPVTGQDSTGICCMAYNVMVVLVLSSIVGK